MGGYNYISCSYQGPIPFILVSLPGHLNIINQLNAYLFLELLGLFLTQPCWDFNTIG